MAWSSLASLGLVVAVSLLSGPQRATAETIALSLVHQSGRIDVPVSAMRLRAKRSITFVIQGTHERRTYESPHVEVCLSPEFRQRLCQLTTRIVEQPLKMVVGCKVVSAPVVREPLCSKPCFRISSTDFAEAQALAQLLRSGSNAACAPGS